MAIVRSDLAFAKQAIGILSQSPRPAGTQNARECCDFFKSSIERTERFAVEETRFEFRQYVPKNWSLSIGEREIECIPALCSTDTHKAGLTGIIRRSDSKDIAGEIALVRIADTHESLAVEELASRGAVGALAYQPNGPLLAGRVKYPRSSIPCLMISATAGAKLWNARGSRSEAKLTCRAELKQGRGRNVFAVPKVSPYRRLFIAHRDSRPFSPGAIDNASGSAYLLLLSKSFSDPGFALLSTDAEEYGLLGARNFGPAKRLESDTAVVNLDSVGSGKLHLVERSRAGSLSAVLNSRINSIAASLGIPLSHLTVPRGSDSDVFIQAGLKASWIRSYPTPTGTTIDDIALHLKDSTLSQCCNLVERLAVTDLSGS